jgi:hypothetical protein
MHFIYYFTIDDLERIQINGSLVHGFTAAVVP